MEQKTLPLTERRTLVVTPIDRLATLLTTSSSQRLVALFGQSASRHAALKDAVRQLVAAGCEAIACYGPESEALHDTVDSVVEAELDPEIRSVVTTWHDDETPAEVAEYFVMVAGRDPGTLLVACLGADESQFAGELLRVAHDFASLDDG